MGGKVVGRMVPFWTGVDATGGMEPIHGKSNIITRGSMSCVESG